MIRVNLTQADLNATPAAVFSSLAPGGLYAVQASVASTPGAGATGTAQVRLSFTNADGQPEAFGASVALNTPAYAQSSRTLFTLAHPSDLELELLDGSGTVAGSYGVELHLYISRVRDEGND